MHHICAIEGDIAFVRKAETGNRCKIISVAFEKLTEKLKIVNLKILAFGLKGFLFKLEECSLAEICVIAFLIFHSFA